MISVEFNEPRNVYLVGEDFDINVGIDDGNSTININVFQVGIENPSFKYSGSTKKEILGFSSTVKTASFAPGYYEAKHIKTFTCNNDTEISNEVNYSGGKDFSRLVFKVEPIGAMPKGKIDVLQEVLSIEDKLEKNFLGGLACGPRGHKRFCVLVFLCGVKITRNMRFGRYEVVPFRGVDGTNYVDLVNDFLATQTKIGINFVCSEELSQTIRNDNPTCIIHFPLVIADKMESAMQYCQQESEILSEVFSAYRSGLGRVIKTVVYDSDTGTGTMFTSRTPYRGNLLGGEISGEDPKSISLALQKVKQHPIKRYFLSIYKDAVNETNIDFSYLRYWQLLETIAESKNYNRNETLRDFDEHAIKNPRGKDVRLNNAKAIVFELIKGHGLGSGVLSLPRGSTELDTDLPEFDLWNRIKCWHSMRNAAGHFGGFVFNDEFLKSNLECYPTCEILYIAQENSKHGFLYRDLESTAWLILRKEIASD